ncbi:unnamed protein product [Parnassius apollo]|uniref:(apollo) hypothetical protein n=1 Tax=Parnassius apollo TaxID=110799 RepID=A0A8S3WCZ3_PARAO|nr:unnamed protein product [Parnassius apollo]
MEVLQSAGEVLEKECDEILSKVQDVTNLDTMSVKPLLNPIAEETMETGDSNDTVDRILDTEIQQMKQNEKSENVDTKKTEIDVNEETEALTVDDKKKSEGSTDKALETSPEQKLSEQMEEKKNEEIVKESEKDPENSKAESKEDNITKETNKGEIGSTEASAEVSVEQKISDSDTKVPLDSKENTLGVEVKPESESAESQVNGKTNGETVPVSLNGDASKDEELSSRLSAENGKQEEVNGSNGDAVVTEKVQEDNKNNLRKHKIVSKTENIQEFVALLAHIRRMTRLRLLPH